MRKFGVIIRFGSKRAYNYDNRIIECPGVGFKVLGNKQAEHC